MRAAFVWAFSIVLVVYTHQGSRELSPAMEAVLGANQTFTDAAVR